MYNYGHHLACLSSHLLSSYSFGTIYQILTSASLGSSGALIPSSPSINQVHSSILSPSNTSFSCSIHVSDWIFNMATVLFTDLTLSFNKALSSFLMIWQPLGVLIELLSLILTGIMSSLKHLKVNLLWFEKSAILFSIFSHIISFGRCYCLHQCNSGW